MGAPTFWLRPAFPRYHQLERAAPRSVACDVACRFPHVFRRHWRDASALDLHWECPVPARGERGPFRPGARDPDRNAWPLQRRGLVDSPPVLLGGIACDPVVFPVVTERFATPQAREHLEPLVEHGLRTRASGSSAR
jgi:hypothetical protein